MNHALTNCTHRSARIALAMTTALAAAGLSLCASAADNTAIPAAFDAGFSVDRSGLPLGTTQFTMKASDKVGCWVYHGKANPNALAHLFLGDVTDESRLCIVDNQVQPQRFSHHIDGKPRKSYTLAFDWQAMQATYDDEAGRHKTYKLVEGAQDPLSLQVAARRWVAAAADPATLGEKTFQMADDDGVEPYDLAATDGGMIKTAAGSFATLKVARTGTHRHALAFWLAREANWIPVQVRQLNDGDTAFTMIMDSLKRGK